MVSAQLYRLILGIQTLLRKKSSNQHCNYGGKDQPAPQEPRQACTNSYQKQGILKYRVAQVEKNRDDIAILLGKIALSRGIKVDP